MLTIIIEKNFLFEINVLCNHTKYMLIVENVMVKDNIINNFISIIYHEFGGACF